MSFVSFLAFWFDHLRGGCRVSRMLAVGGMALAGAFAAESEPAPPRLAVVIVIDQARADYLDRFAPYFGPKGFRRLLDHGSNYVNCHYEHAVTKTAVGHATIATGAHPSVHGIVANDWLDAVTWEMSSAVAGNESPIIGGAPGQPGRSPHQLRATTIGDALKARYGDAARVFAVANKDRSAILPAGKRGDGAFWLGDNDRLVSSRYYYPDDRLPGWVEAFNATEPVAACFGQTWERMLDAAEYDRTQGPDDAPGEFAGLGLGRTFPRIINGGRKVIGREFSDAFDRSPFALEIVATFARQLVQREHVGSDAVPDLLYLGFSQIDTVGHDYGPDSHEVMDSFLRLDRIVGELLAFFDEEVGVDRYVVAVTADHGVPSMPEHLHAAQPDVPATRVDLRQIDRVVTSALVQAFGPAPENRPWCRRDNAGYRLSAEAMAATGVSLAQAARVVRSTLLEQPVIAEVFTAEELASAPVEGSSIATLLRRSQFAPRSPDVVFAMKPFHIDRLNHGATHGTPYDYDTHVPLLWFGPGVPQARVIDRVGVTDLAPTLAALLGLPPLPQASGRRLF